MNLSEKIHNKDIIIDELAFYSIANYSANAYYF